ncbi:PG1828 family lipoprotein [Arundinibacter roseus]|uniref:PG1828 family lipoprotein n=1 Tax=Arundinibacter roseus TaxID=2070510 RepID=UPI001404DF57|nr:hypothetical protein [Arundinibacter roseus]
MKKVLAFAFVAGMITFASCTSKPAEEEATTDTTMTIEADTTMAVDTMAVDTTMATDSL